MTNPRPTCARTGVDPHSDDDTVRDMIATALCPGCPIRTQCHDMGADEHWGVWGGVDRTIKPRRASLRVPADRAADRVHLLQHCGWSKWRIAVTSGVTVRMVERLAARQVARVSHCTEDALLAVTP